MFTGSMVALVTPFKNGKVDERALGDLIDIQIREGTSAIVPCGTTGESATLSHAEHNRVIELTVQAVNGRAQVIAGSGSNSTVEAIKLTRYAKQVHADAALLICPYYNKPSQEGLFQHFKAIASAVDIPLVLYNIPSRTGVNLLPGTVTRLMEMKSIVGIKESSGSLPQISEVIRQCGDRLSVISGDDALTLPILAVGGKGVISVAANIIPKELSQMVLSALKGSWDEARQIHHRLSPLFEVLFIDTNPAPVKAALKMMGHCADEVRLPLSALSDENRQKLESTLKQQGLL